MRNPQHRRPFRVVDTDRRTPQPLPQPLPPPGQPVGAVALAAAGDRLARAALAVARAVETREYDHIGAESCPLLAELLEARRQWVRCCTRWESHQ
jgi:hypothetical protein